MKSSEFIFKIRLLNTNKFFTLNFFKSILVISVLLKSILQNLKQIHLHNSHNFFLTKNSHNLNGNKINNATMFNY